MDLPSTRKPFGDRRTEPSGTEMQNPQRKLGGGGGGGSRSRKQGDAERK